MTPAPRRSLRTARTWIVLALLGAGTAACGASSSNDEAVRPACEVLAMGTPTGPRTNDAGGEPTETPLGAALPLLFADVNPSLHVVRVYLDPTIEDPLVERINDEIDRADGVLRTRYIDRDETFADFEQLFAHEDAMIAITRPEDLPTSIEAVVSGRAAAAALREGSIGRPGVYEVNSTEGPDRIEALDRLAGSFVARRDRDRWSTLADRLDRIEDRPAWGEEGARLIREVLEDGTALQLDADRAEDLDAAREAAVRAATACRD